MHAGKSEIRATAPGIGNTRSDYGLLSGVAQWSIDSTKPTNLSLSNTNAHYQDWLTYAFTATARATRESDRGASRMRCHMSVLPPGSRAHGPLTGDASLLPQGTGNNGRFRATHDCL
ncbi:hypothetical protein PoB_000631000 [Plakobranchus ocellatus]|uniref:Uncharacterized protein n=1 Tax=Plakobranchus ocellatus TaxID=259542 RepID=A0AAV3Y9N0_9GAST|nr:hypothetical protein PoB_000631000 [Plakobranchus ocellatus]